MARRERTTEYYVRVDPQRLGNFPGVGSVSDRLVERDEAKRLKMYRESCEAMVDQIKRHVDGVGAVTVVKEAEFVCSHCGLDWTEGPDHPHNGGCCVTDWNVYKAALTKAEGKS